MRIYIFLIFALSFIFYANKIVIADTDFIQLKDTTHSYSNGEGSYSIDGNWNSAQSMGASGDYDSNAAVVSEHTFAIPRAITLLKFKMEARGHVYGDEEQNCGAHIAINYFDGSWHQVYAANDNQGGNSSAHVYSGDSAYEIKGPLHNVTIIRASANGNSHSNGDSRTNDSSAAIYEIQAWGNIDIGLRANDGTGVVKIACEPAGVLASPLRLAKNGVTYSIILVDPSDPSASKIRIKTASGVKALKKYI
ncbi:MAG: hypothetical protein WC628_07345 [Candidatus Omnitrophota bacterium]